MVKGLVQAATLNTSASETKKADVAEHPKVSRHVGLLVNEPPGQAGLPFTQSSDSTPQPIVSRGSLIPLDIKRFQMSMDFVV
jgi:hypothetical protein